MNIDVPAKPDSVRIHRHIGECIRRRRAEMGLTQEDLAAALQVSYQQIQKYETGINRISAGRLFDVAGALGVEMSYFFSGFDAAHVACPLPHGGNNRAAIELVRNFLELEDESLRAAVTNLIRALREQQERARASG